MSLWELSMCRHNNCTNLHNDGYDGSSFDNRDNNDSFDHSNANDNFGNHSCNNNFIHRTSDVFAYDDSKDNNFNFYHDGHYGFHFNNQNHHDNGNHNFGNHNSVNNIFSFIYNYLNRASDDHDSINAFDNQLDSIVHCAGSKYTDVSK